jgi:hypothetical protein
MSTRKTKPGLDARIAREIKLAKDKKEARKCQKQR